ncbi:MAG: hypothetical protein KKF48_05800 [Nanoarchaeota archaeon]|nr:hypothetical protein [Nanoarchaeota archaeon]
MTFARVNGAGWTDDTTTVTAAQLNQLDTNVTNAIDGLSGGTYTPAGVIQINGAGSTAAIGGAAPATFGGAAGGVLLSETTGAASNVRLAGRQVQRLLPMGGRCSYTGFANTWETQATTGYWWQVLTGGHVFIDLPLPHNQRLDQVTVKYVGSASYVGPALPAIMPILIVEKVTAMGVVSLAGPGGVADPSATTAAFQAHHDITVPAISATIDRSTYWYRAKIIGDDGAGFVSGSYFVSIYALVTCTGYTEY